MDAEQGHIERERAAAAGFWRDSYCQAFMDKDAGRYADQFALPCMIKAEGLPRTAFSTRAALLDYVSEMLRRAEESTWHRSSIDRCDVSLLDRDVARVSVDATRFDAADRPISRLYGEYTLNKVEGAWKMVAIFGGFYPD
jgi:hypothetical protein